MVRFDRCAGSFILFLAITMLGASPATAGKTVRPEFMRPKDGGFLTTGINDNISSIQMVP